MSRDCPTCGQTLPPMPGVKFDHDANVAIIDGRVFALTSSLMDLAIILHDRMPNVVRKEAIYELLTANKHEIPEPKIIDVFICKLRPIFADSSIELKTIWGRGYQMVPRVKSHETV